MMTASVIVPVYKVEKYLCECIDSILNQTFTDFELILVDDGSPDNCPKICDEYAKKDSRIIVIHKENGGVSSARNAGLDIAKGKYISFVDSDDYVDKHLLELCINKIKELNCDSIRFAYTKVQDSNETIYTKTIIPYFYAFRTSYDKVNFLSEQLLSYKIPVNVTMCLFKGDIIRNNNIRFVSEKIIYAEDAFFSSQYIFHSGNCLAIDTPLYFFRNNLNSIVNTHEVNRDILINKYVCWCKTLFDFCDDDIIKNNFYYLSTAFIKNEIKFSVEKKNIEFILSSIKELEDRKYFSLQFKKYYDSIKKNYKKNYGIKRTINDFAFIKFFISQNYFSFMFKILIIRLMKVIKIM